MLTVDKIKGLPVRFTEDLQQNFGLSVIQAADVNFADVCSQ